jgi:hypothetical protein
VPPRQVCALQEVPRHDKSGGAKVSADESGAWNALLGKFEIKRLNHQEAYSLDGACTKWRCSN